MGDQRYGENKCPSPIPPRVLKIDAENYMVNGNNAVRPRSFSFTNGTTKPFGNSYHNINRNPGDRRPEGFGGSASFSSSNMSFSPSVVKPPSPLRSISSPPPSFSCARTLSFHSLFCSCHISCCCSCDSLCPPDCDDCIRAICVKFTASYHCHSHSEILPPSTLRDKVSCFYEKVLHTNFCLLLLQKFEDLNHGYVLLLLEVCFSFVYYLLPL